MIAAIATWNELKQMDVDSAYLNALLMETIYMQQPMGCEVASEEQLVCWLLRALYGLRQAGRELYFHFYDACHDLISSFYYISSSPLFSILISSFQPFSSCGAALILLWVQFPRLYLCCFCFIPHLASI